jgi:hypothetical protein
MLTVRDASLVTKRNQGKAVNAYYNDWKSRTVTASPAALNMAATSPGVSGAESLIEKKVGCDACVVYSNELLKRANPSDPAVDANLSLYPANASSSGGINSQGPS